MNNLMWNQVKLISNRKRLGKVWLVKKQTTSGYKTGFFKYTNTLNEKYVGPLAANEYIAYRLGKKLNLPMATVHFVKINGKSGIVSYRRKGKLMNWKQFKAQVKSPFQRMNDPARLLQMFVFDIWIANIDRNNRNIILFRNGHSYHFYLIDHGLSLLGALVWKKVHYTHSYWDHVALYNRRYLNGLPEYIKENKDQLNAYIQQIQHIPNHFIESIVNQVPSKFLSLKQKNITYNFLVQRKMKLPRLIQRWLIEYKK